MGSPWQYLPGSPGFNPDVVSNLIVLVLVVGMRAFRLRRGLTLLTVVSGVGLIVNANIIGHTTFTSADVLTAFVATSVSLVAATPVLFSGWPRASLALRITILLCIAGLALEDLRFLTGSSLFAWIELFVWLGAGVDFFAWLWRLGDSPSEAEETGDEAEEGEAAEV